MNKGEELNLKIDALAFGGQGVARLNGYVIFVEGAIPGQMVRARVFRRHKDYAQAKTLQVIENSVDETEPRCMHFGECGGCRFQNLAYKAQLRYKRQQVVESLEHIGGFQNPPVLEILASPDTFYYRNKMEFSFGSQRWLSHSEIDRDDIAKPKNFALGLHIRRRFDKILDIDVCYLQSPFSTEIVNAVREQVLQSKIPPYETKNHTGFWRHLVIREGKNTGQSMINLVTAGNADHFQAVDKLANHLSTNFDTITTIVHTVNRKKAQVAFGHETRILFGSGSIQEKIGNRVFSLSANSFFQTNPKGAEILYNQVVDFANFNKDEVVYDLYCGAGTISIFIADKVKKVVGFEIVDSAVRDAVMNRDLNGVNNCFFVAGDLKDILTDEAIGNWGRPSTIIIDPPRAGMHSNVTRQVLNLAPEKIIYVSCNPATFARDVRQLCESQYSLQRVQAVDMFPMTPHIELVSSMKKRS